MTVRRYLAPLVLGLSGTLVLVSLGLWQVQRLQWKESVLAEIEARIVADPATVPDAPDIGLHRFMPVAVKGDFDGTDVPVFLSHDSGPIYRLIAAFQLEDGRRILVDRGGIPGRGDPTPEMRTAPMRDVEIVGNLHWPDEVDKWTPEPDNRGVFFGRDITAMAEVLGTEPVLIVAREISANTPPATPLPVTTTGIPNNHLGYAVQWFGLAFVWAGMTAFLMWRIRGQTS